MHDVYFAALGSARTTLDIFDEVLDGLPDEAATWVPVEGANSLAILVRHGLTATAYLGAQAAGLNPDRDQYLSHDRPDAFKASGTSISWLRGEIAKMRDDIGLILARGTEESLAATVPWRLGVPKSDEGKEVTGAELLFHLGAHLREHAGQAELTRDLWKARAGA